MAPGSPLRHLAVGAQRWHYVAATASHRAPRMPPAQAHFSMERVFCFSDDPLVHTPQFTYLLVQIHSQFLAALLGAIPVTNPDCHGTQRNFSRFTKRTSTNPPMDRVFRIGETFVCFLIIGFLRTQNVLSLRGHKWYQKKFNLEAHTRVCLGRI